MRINNPLLFFRILNIAYNEDGDVYQKLKGEIEMKLKENYFLSRLVGFGVLLGGIKYFDKVTNKAFRQGYDKGYSTGKIDGIYERGRILKKED